MPATYTAHHELASRERRLLDFDPPTGNAELVTLDPASSGKCLPIALFHRFVAGLMRSVGTGGITSFKIIAATAADGTGNTAVVAHALGSAPDAVGDTVWLECDADQIKEVLPTATHVGVEIDLVTATDECVVSFERCEPTYTAGALTADYVA